MNAETSAPTAVIVLCPGQGAQHVGMGKTWADKHAAAKQTFEEADRLLGFALSQLCFTGPEDQLNRTDMAQLAIYVSSVACYRALVAANKLGKLSTTAGLSLGEFTALHLAGAFDFATGLELVRLRGRAMQDAAEASKSGMVALVGADETQAQLVCDQTLAALPAGQVLVPANFNCPGQIIISGTMDACAKSMEIAQQIGVKTTALKVAGAFHSPVMQPAAQRLAEALDKVTWTTPHVPVLSNVTGQLHQINRADSIKARLVQQLTSPVRWEQSMAWAIAHVPGQFVELAPNKVLSGLMRRIDRAIKVENFADPA